MKCDGPRGVRGEFEDEGDKLLEDFMQVAAEAG